MAHEPGDMLVKVLGPLPRDRALWTYTSGAIVIPVKPLRIDDAFEPDGTYLGTLAVPDDFVTRGPEPPSFDGEHVWAVEGYRGKRGFVLGDSPSLVEYPDSADHIEISAPNSIPPVPRTLEPSGPNGTFSKSFLPVWRS